MAKSKNKNTLIITVAVAGVAVIALVYWLINRNNTSQPPAAEEQDVETETLGSGDTDDTPSTNEPPAPPVPPATYVPFTFLGQETVCVTNLAGEFPTWDFDESQPIPEYEGFGQDVSYANMTGVKDYRKTTAKAFFKAINTTLSESTFLYYQDELERYDKQFHGIHWNEVRQGALICPKSSNFFVGLFRIR